jgi:hypothetical protein
VEIASPLKPETFRPFATLVIPGTAATAPYIAGLAYRSPAIRAFVQDHELIFGTLCLLVVVAAGFVLEDVGSRIEKRAWLPLQGDANEEGIWWEYLRTAFIHEPVGQRYLRTIVLRLKFELSFGLSLIPMWLGFLWLNRQVEVIPGSLWCAFSILTFLLCAVLLFESYRSTVLLTRIRRELAKSIITQPTQRVQNDEPAASHQL